MLPLPCRLDVPPPFRPKAWYALEELLRPLGLVPVEGDVPTLYYGERPEASSAPLALRCAAGTPGFFAEPRPLAPEAAGWVAWDGERWPAPVRSGDAERFGGADLVASAFWWLSGWQEVATRERDAHGRFPFSASLQAALGTAHLPAVDAYRCVLADVLERIGVPAARRGWGSEGKSWAVLLSHDVDRVRRRRSGTLARGLLGGDLAPAARRAFAPGNADLRGLQALLAEAEQRGGHAAVFAKAGRTGRLDAPYRLSAEVQAAFRDAAARGHEIGLHPSTFAMRHPGHLHAERGRLERAVGERLTAVRAHYLRFDPLHAPTDLAEAGVEVDSSLGFSAAPGYRRGTGCAFRLWDLRQGRPAGLWEVPLVVMDTTLLHHQGLSPGEAAAEARVVLHGARRTGSCAAVLWHNRPLDEPAGTAAMETYQRVLGDARTDGAALLTVRAAVARAAGTEPW